MVKVSPTAAKRSAAQNNGETSPSADDSASLAAYIADMTAELAGLAGNARLPMLAYFLNLARVEAQIYAREYARENDSREIARER